MSEKDLIPLEASRRVETPSNVLQFRKREPVSDLTPKAPNSKHSRKLSHHPSESDPSSSGYHFRAHSLKEMRVLLLLQ